MMSSDTLSISKEFSPLKSGTGSHTHIAFPRSSPSISRSGLGMLHCSQTIAELGFDVSTAVAHVCQSAYNCHFCVSHLNLAWGYVLLMGSVSLSGFFTFRVLINVPPSDWQLPCLPRHTMMLFSFSATVHEAVMLNTPKILCLTVLNYPSQHCGPFHSCSHIFTPH